MALSTGDAADQITAKSPSSSTSDQATRRSRLSLSASQWIFDSATKVSFFFRLVWSFGTLAVVQFSTGYAPAVQN